MAVTIQHIGRLYAGFCALVLTLTISIGLGGALYPRPHMPDDIAFGLCIAAINLPIAIPLWHAALFYRPKT